jgi:hypothetical protein
MSRVTTEPCVEIVTAHRYPFCPRVTHPLFFFCVSPQIIFGIHGL